MTLSAVKHLPKRRPMTTTAKHPSKEKSDSGKASPGSDAGEVKCSRTNHCGGTNKHTGAARNFSRSQRR
jgi:hypothetical protein